MTPIESLLTRSSLAGAFLGLPAPSAEQVRDILGAAQRASDHGKLRPWRFFVLKPEHYGAFFDRLAQAAARAQGDPARAVAQREKYTMHERAPLIVVAAAKLQRGHKIHETEQMLAAGGATQLVLNATHALGFAAYLSSGKGVFDSSLKADFGLTADDHLIGFICIGTPNVLNRGLDKLPEQIKEGLALTTTQWRGPGDTVPLDD
ncbi:MAG: nitroreductase [Steroidobacteraceae bacterium]